MKEFIFLLTNAAAIRTDDIENTSGVERPKFYGMQPYTDSTFFKILKIEI